MKNFWKQISIFGGVVVLAAIIILVYFYQSGVGSKWTVYKLNGEETVAMTPADISELKTILNQVEKSKATQEEIDNYINANEWTGFVFSNDEIGTVFSFSSNLNMLAVYQSDWEANVVSIEENTSSTITKEQTQEIVEKIDLSNFTFYTCTPEQLESINKIYNNYF